MRPALTHVCGKQTLGAGKLFFRVNLWYVPNIRMYQRLRSKSAHFLSTCLWKTATQWQNPIFPAAKHVFLGSCNRAAVLHTQVTKKCTDLDLSLLHILILGAHSKFARENNFLALVNCFPQMLERWPHLVCVKSTLTLPPTNCFVSSTTNSMKCLGN